MENIFKSGAYIIIDTTGLRCPLPVLKVQKDIRLLKIKDKALIIADDPLARVDLNHFCQENNYFLEELKTPDQKKQYYFIKRMEFS